MLGSFWDHFGFVLLTFWDDFRIILYIILGSFLVSFWDHFGIICSPLGSLGGSLGLPGELGGSLEVSLVHPRPPFGSQAARGVLPGIFREFSGRFREPFWLHFGSLFCDFSSYFSASFFDRFLCRFFIDFEWILEVFFMIFLIFFVVFAKSRKCGKLHLVQARAQKSRVGGVENDPKMHSKW